MDNFDTPEASSQANESENSTFLTTAPTANPVFYRTYSRRINGDRESWDDVVRRTTQGLAKLGQFSQEEADLIEKMQRQLKALPSGRWLWVGGTKWLDKPENVSGAYNCTNLNVIDWRSFGLMMDLAMMGCGTGAILEPKYIQQLPPIRNRLIVSVVGKIGDTPAKDRQEETTMKVDGNQVYIRVGDSRQGWSSSYEKLLSLSTNQWFKFDGEAHVTVDVSDVRPEGESLKGFGGVANPVRLTGLYDRCAAILNRAIGRQLTSVECCLLIDEAAATVVAGNIRRCLPEDAIVHTPQGLIPIKDIEVGDLVRTPLGFCKVTNKFDQGVQDVYTINTSETPLRSTLNHRHAVLDENKLEIIWKQASDLVPGDRLVHEASYASLNLQSLPHLGGEGSNDPIPQKESGSENTGTGKVRVHKLYRLETENNDCYLSVNPVTVEGIGGFKAVQTYDIEVEEAHCFYCDYYLTHNSAGMRQGISSDEQFAVAKDNLWQQDESGNWRIDPERDVLRMANHTRVFHHQPTEQECIEAVRKQFYSGEGAIQYAPEAIARSSADLLPTEEIKAEFLAAICRGQGEEWLREKQPTMPEEEVQHRMARYGLNPCGEVVSTDFHCVAGDTMLIIRDGMRPIKELVGQSVEVWNGQRWSEVVPVLTGQNRQLYRVSFSDGTYLDVTEQHRFFVKDRFGKAYEEVTTGELGDRLEASKYAIHTEPFQIDYRDGKFVDPSKAYTLGLLVGDGSICQSHGKAQLQLRLYGLKRHEKDLAVAGKTSGVDRYYTKSKQTPCLLYVGFQDNFDPEHVRSLKTNANALDELAMWNRESILHFVAGLADTDGSGVPSGGIRIYISDYDRAYRVYLLLLKCGIRSSINLLAKAGTETNFGTRKKDLWYLQITDCSAIPCQRLNVSNGHLPRFKGKWQVVESVKVLEGLHDTFCFNEPEFHKGVFGGTLTGQCNLSEIHLNQIDPLEYETQYYAFTAGALSVAALLNHKFTEPRYQYSRDLDPIVGVSFTGLFDFFVNAFGVDWLKWWEVGRPDTEIGRAFKRQEEEYLTSWRNIVHHVVWDYCDRHNLKRPNRCTVLQPAGSKSLLTGASPGWHPPKAQRYIRRITFRRDDPVALACLDYGYSIVPSQTDKDEHGHLLQDPFDPRCTEWLVEIPVEIPWANLPGADEIAIEKFSAEAQFDFYMMVQRHYTTHNTSSTIELREPEIESLGRRIHQAIQQNEGYISSALLARFDDLQTFPRLPFEPISKAQYDQFCSEVLARRKTDNFHESMLRHDAGELIEAGPAGCDSDKCLLPEKKG